MLFRAVDVSNPTFGDRVKTCVRCVRARVCLCVCYSFEFRSERVCGACVCLLYVHVCSCIPLCFSSATLHLCAPAPLAPPSYAPLLLCRSSFSGFSFDFNCLPQELIGLSIDWSVSSTQHGKIYASAKQVTARCQCPFE
jgi:hypothetical protein